MVYQVSYSIVQETPYMLTHLLKRVFPLLMLVNLTLPLVPLRPYAPTGATRHDDDDDDDLSTFAGIQNAFLISHDQVVI